MRILVTDGMDKGAIEKVRAMGHELVEQFYEPDELGKALRDFDVAIIRSKTKLRAKQIDEAKGSRFKCVIRAGVGLDNIDVQYAKDNGIEVKNTPKSPSESVAELAMAHMFSCARYISIAGHSMREGKWEKKAYGKGIELTGKTLGIVGFGRIGQKLGKMAKAIGMNVIAFDIFHIPGIEEQLGIPYVEMDELLAGLPGITVVEPKKSTMFLPNYWLTTIKVDSNETSFSALQLMQHLAKADIETRPLWKPLHLQPVFSSSPTYVNGVSEALFNCGLCLPSGSMMTCEDVMRVADAIRSMR